MLVDESQPAVSVVVSTRNRPDQIVPCLRSILQNEGAPFELVVVDQSDSDVSRLASEALSDPRLRWISSDTRGLSISRNIAICNTRADLIIFTDDDCRVPKDWLLTIQQAFDADPEAALIFGRVERADSEEEGFAAAFDPPCERSYQHEFPHVMEPWGIGAHMALRRSTLNEVGPFDPVLGAGARFFGGEDADMTIRVLAAGMKVVCTRVTTVKHLGVRKGDEASRLMRGYGMGMGATLVKHVRSGTQGANKLLAQWLLLQSKRALGNALTGVRPSGLGLVAFTLLGAGQALLQPLDARRVVYAATEGL